MLRRSNAALIASDLAREVPVVMPAHFEADAYAGMRRMAMTQKIQREDLPTALARLADLDGERIAIRPLLSAAYELFDRIGAHDAFYVALALSREATLLTADAPLARAALQLSASVILRQPEAIA